MFETDSFRMQFCWRQSDFTTPLLLLLVFHSLQALIHGQALSYDKGAKYTVAIWADRPLLHCWTVSRVLWEQCMLDSCQTNNTVRWLRYNLSHAWQCLIVNKCLKTTVCQEEIILMVLDTLSWDGSTVLKWLNHSAHIMFVLHWHMDVFHCIS